MGDEAEVPLWYKHSDDSRAVGHISDELLISLKDEAKKCLDADVASYNIKNSKTNSNFQWMKTVMSKGVVSDKVAANVVTIQDSPLHNLDKLSTLIGMVKVGKKKECITVVESLVELFLTSLLPPTRKLLQFSQRPLNKLNDVASGDAVKRRKRLMSWYFEDQLKEIYCAFVRALNTLAQDTVDANKEKAILAMYKLLAENPEQEKNLLSHLVNKLGDPSRKVASKTIYCLTRLLRQHSSMQGVVLNEIEKMLFRPNISPKAQYYGLCFLSQYYLCHEAAEVAGRLIEVYFSFFKACVKKGDVNSRMMSALLIGVNRAFPYAKLEMEKISGHIDTMYRVVHIANFNIGLHALMLLYQVTDSNVNDRFYSALYRKLFDPQIINTTHQAMLLSLIYKALTRDIRLDRVKVMVKRLLQIALYMPSAMVCGILYLVSQLVGKRPELSALVVKASFLEDSDDEEKYHDVKEEETREEAEEANENSEEKYEDTIDATKEEGIEEEDEEQNEGKLEEAHGQVSSWIHTTAKAATKNKTTYDGDCRNPLYAGGRFCAYFELVRLRHHFHPSVTLFAENLLNGQTISYSGDPLKDFSLIKFLERFVFKNPKKPDPAKAVNPLFAKRKNYTPHGVRGRAVWSDAYVNENVRNIPVEERFLYEFLQKRQRTKPEEEDSDVDSVDSDEFEEMLDKMAGAKKADDLDFMDEVGESLKAKKKHNKMDDDDDAEIPSEDDDLRSEDDVLSGDDDDNEKRDDLNDDEFSDDGEDLADLSDDEGSDLVFDSDGEEEQKVRKKMKKDDIQSLFASADEFASLLENEGSAKRAPGGPSSWANKDNANTKQIAWEEKRNQWIKGFNKKVKPGGGKFSKGKPGNKRKFGSNSNFHNKKRKNK